MESKRFHLFSSVKCRRCQRGNVFIPIGIGTETTKTQLKGLIFHNNRDIILYGKGCFLITSADGLFTSIWKREEKV